MTRRTPSMTTEAGSSMASARFMFAFDAITAGAIGAGLLAAPRRIGQLLLGAPQDPLISRLAGAVFAGFGLVSVAGAREPARYLPLFLVQGAYKALWLATTATALRKRPAAAGMAASFLVYLAGYAVALYRADWPLARHGRSARAVGR